jgi:hypothetical protein
MHGIVNVKCALSFKLFAWLGQKFGKGDVDKNLVKEMSTKFGKEDIYKNFGKGDVYRNFGKGDVYQNFGKGDVYQNFGKGDVYKNLVKETSTKIW